VKQPEKASSLCALIYVNRSAGHQNNHCIWINKSVKRVTPCLRQYVPQCVLQHAHQPAHWLCLSATCLSLECAQGTISQSPLDQSTISTSGRTATTPSPFPGVPKWSAMSQKDAAHPPMVSCHPGAWPNTGDV